MSDIPPGGPPGGEVNIAGAATFRPTGRPNLFQRMAFGRQGITSSVQASLKFDIPGLKDFRTELEAIKKTLDSLDASFKKISTSPLAWAKSLRAANDELRAMNALGTAAPGAPIPVMPVGAGGVSPGSPRIGTLITGARAAMGARAGGAGMGGSAMAGLGSMGVSAGAGQVGGMIASAVTAGMSAAFAKFEQTMDKTMQADIYASRMAGMTGVTAPRQFGAQGRRGGMPFYAGFVETNQVLYQGGMLGAVSGGPGLPGQRGGAFSTGVMQLQNLMPGMSATQGAAVVAQGMQNVQGMKQAAVGLFGQAALMYKPGGKLKTQVEYYAGILKRLQGMPRGPRSQKAPGTPWSTEEIEAQMFPGSIADTWLDNLGFSPEMKEAFWNYAVSQSRSEDPASFAATRAQMEKIRGPSVATAGQAVERRQGAREAAEGARQFDNQLTRLRHEEQMIGILQSIDRHVAPLVGLLGEVPGPLQGIAKKGGGMIAGAGAGAATGAILGSIIPGAGTLAGAGIGAVAGGLAGFFAGDPGPEGGLSHLSPDLRSRVAAMMAANPNLRINSAYRDNLRQHRLQGKGPFAPSGKSKHGRGMAVDFGPASQMGWLNANARAFGLDTAAHMGEPWHVQLAGSMGFMGDPMDPHPNLSWMLGRAQERWLTSLTVGAQQQAAAAAAAASGSSVTPVDPTAAAPVTGGAAPSPGAATPGSQTDLARAQALKARTIKPQLTAIPGNGQMDVIAAASMNKVLAAFGHPIGNVGTFRSFEEQARHCDASGHGPDCGRFAPAGKSLHEVGLAIDVINSVTGGLDNPALVNAFTNAGWFRRGAIINGRNEPWHWTYMVPGDPGYLGDVGGGCGCGGMGDLPSNATAARLRELLAAGENRWLAALKAGAASPFAGVSASGAVNLGTTGVSGTATPTPSGAAPAPVAPGGVGGGAVQDPHNIFTYLRQNSVSQASAAGILGNVYFESKFNPSIIGDHGTSGGLFQHHAGRWTALKNYAASTNRPWTDWKAQVEFALQEARSSGYGINLNATDPGAAATEWALKFEKMSGGASSAAQRAARAPMYMYAGDPAVDYDGYMGTMSGGMGFGGGSGSGGVSVNSKAVNFHNSFNITLSGTPPSRDIDAAVKQIMSRLEVQMRRAVSRSN